MVDDIITMCIIEAKNAIEDAIPCNNRESAIPYYIKSVALSNLAIAEYLVRVVEKE